MVLGSLWFFGGTGGIVVGVSCYPDPVVYTQNVCTIPLFAVRACLLGYPSTGHLPPHDTALGPRPTQPAHLSHRGSQKLHHEAKAEEHLPTRASQGGPDHR